MQGEISQHNWSQILPDYVSEKILQVPSIAQWSVGQA